MLSDENIAGELNKSLTLMLTGKVVSGALADDYNNDGVVDSIDYVVWRKSLANNMLLDNETASAGVTDQADLDAWRANFGATMGASGLSSSTVPEPGAIFLLASAAVAISVRRTRRS